MIVVGVLLLAAGFLLEIALLWRAGLVLLVVGPALFVNGALESRVGRRRFHY
jgi:hypothetical protein